MYTPPVSGTYSRSENSEWGSTAVLKDLCLNLDFVVNLRFDLEGDGEEEGEGDLDGDIGGDSEGEGERLDLCLSLVLCLCSF